MQSEELQQLTASEPLTLEQEYDMQRQWQEDANSMYLKYTKYCRISLSNHNDWFLNKGVI